MMGMMKYLCEVVFVRLKGTVSRDVLGIRLHKWIDIGLNKRRAWFIIFLKCPLNLQSHLTISSG
jgi:hypothetical protein